jgi:preprotein translocase subunit YajC
MKIRNVLLIISIIVLISFVSVFIYDTSNVERQKQENQRINQSALPPGSPAPPRPEDQVLKVPLSTVLLSVGLILIAFYFAYNFLEKNFKRELSVITNIAKDDKITISSNAHDDVNKTIMNLLSPNERQIVKQLVENHGVCLQSDISKMNNIGKVKAHRYLQNLLKMGVVKIEPYGNTNKVSLSENVKKIFIK